MSRQLEGWLDKADLEYGPARAIIAPYVQSQKYMSLIESIYFFLFIPVMLGIPIADRVLDLRTVK